jgi:tetratricopeptide (TPR) repeat protein
MPTKLSLFRAKFAPPICGLALAIALVQPQSASADEQFDRGMRLYGNKLYQAALPYFEESYRTTPWDSKACYYKALCLHQMGEHAKALAAYKTLIKNFPGSSAAGLAKTAVAQLTPLVAAKGTGQGNSAVSGGRTSTTAAAEEKQFELPFSWEPGGKAISVAIEVNGRNTTATFDNNRSDIFIPSKGDLERLSVPVPIDPDEANYAGTNRVINAVPKEFDVVLEKVKAGKVEKAKVQAKYQDLGEGKPVIGKGFFSGWQSTIDNGRRVIIFRKQ